MPVRFCCSHKQVKNETKKSPSKVIFLMVAPRGSPPAAGKQDVTLSGDRPWGEKPGVERYFVTVSIIFLFRNYSFLTRFLVS